MLEFFEIELPQLPVEDFQGMMHSRREFSVITNPEVYLYGYFRRKFYEIAVRHSIINDLLQEIYISHSKERKQRQESEYYHFDVGHYKENQNISVIGYSLKQLTEELITIFYFAHYLKAYKQWAGEVSIEKKIEELKMISDIEVEMNVFELLFNELKRTSSQNFFVFDDSIQMIVENEPMIYIPTKRNFIFADLEKITLSSLVGLYKNAFELSKSLFNKIAPTGFILH